MAMISGGDESARNAFRAYLRDDSSQLSILATEELDPNDVLEVRNLADAIERAERALSSRPRDGRDMFAELGGPAPTDDASGPAVFAPYIPTPVPPAPVEKTPRPTLVIPKSAGSTQPLPVLMVPSEEDAFTQPGGRMRHFAEETLDGYRPDSTLQLRLRARRNTFAWVVGAIVAVLAIALGTGVLVACLPSKAETKAPEAPKVEAKAETNTETTSDAPAPKKSDVPTMNVNDLPAAH